MKSFFSTTASWVKRHKILAAVLILVIGVVTWRIVHAMTSTAGETTYVLGTVEKGTIVASVSGTGQVSASNQVDIKSKASGDLIYLNAVAGQQVAQGALIGKIDSGDAAYELETAKLEYEKLVNVDPDDLNNAKDTVADASANLKDADASGRAALATAVTDMTDVMHDLQTMESTGYLNVDNNFTVSTTGKTYARQASDSWYGANKLLTDFMKRYRTVSSTTSDSDIEALLTDANEVATHVSESAKYAKDAVIYLRKDNDKNATEADSAYTAVTSLVSKANSAVSDTLSAKNDIANDVRALKNAQHSLSDVTDGPDTLDVRATELSLRQKEEAYENYFVRAPFAGVLASVDRSKGESISNGDTIATLITKQKIAEISLNEIDAAKVAVGQKATITFDAVDGLTITGTVIEADLVGTVSQGVVSYTIKIGFDTDDDRVKPGMTANANIITGTSQDVLTVSASAVKTQGDTSYVEVPNETVAAGSVTGVTLATAPKQVTVQTGLASDDSVEIVSGLEEGETYIVRSVSASSTAKTSTTTAPSLFGGSNTRSGAAGATRAFTR